MELSASASALVEAGPVAAGNAGNAGNTGAATAAEAATGMGEEISRFMRQINAMRQRMRDDPGVGDRLLLGRLVLGGPRRATDLAADTFLDLSTVSRQIRCLVDSGLVRRTPDPDDRRGALLSATAAGVTAYQHFRDQRNEHLARIFDAWPPEDRHQLVRLFGRFNDDFAENYHRLSAGQAGATPPAAAAAAQQGEHA
ncbi:MarR family transcriptional regulator [Streptacidiphilus sp. PB12-B1b]|uniref:MarR family winged helix-turn-helix transcriptional regulator n=1 Tax=Streptacidiphilus sp. PB12-B1b TaxID=2705012 RepID=UPI0015F8B836|nr:MarR family transcriptional regulator [Streptacidiphilus sp. PB12-B1b]QMU74532.1 MarR family transcriptional regulator [Streptacidiphilus sp. PB12-B1b]